MDEEALFARVAAAETIGEICASLGVNRATFYRWVSANEERRKAFDSAREDSADTYAEMSLETLRTPVASSHEATMAKALADRQAWMAEKLGRRVYGSDPAVNITNNNLSLGDLHLDALRKFGTVLQGKPVAEIPTTTGEGE